MYKNRQIHLCAFYNFGLFPSYLRFVEQLSPLQQRYNITTHIYNEYTLPRDEKFDLLLRPKMKQGRGFGYWCWKPYIILHTLQAMGSMDKIRYFCVFWYAKECGHYGFSTSSWRNNNVGKK